MVLSNPVDGLDPKTLVVMDRYRLDKETALIGTNQGLFVIKLNDKEEIVRVTVFGKGEQK